MKGQTMTESLDSRCFFRMQRVKKGEKKGRILIWKMLKNGENVYYDLPRARYAKGGNWKQACYSILAVALSRE